MGSSDNWLQEAVLEYLKSPLYEQPVMDFLDDRCLIFDMEEENKFEYTEIHEEFKALVDQLITGYLGDLGVSTEDFYEVLCAAGPKKLNDLVISTVLMVDDFPQFRALMMKRNLELSNQVLKQLEGSEADESDTLVGPEACASDFKKLLPVGASKRFASTEQNSSEESCGTDKSAEFKDLMADDEDPDLAWAIAESLRQTCANQLEVAELEQAIALSLAVTRDSDSTAPRLGVDHACPSGSHPVPAIEKGCFEGKSHPSYMLEGSEKSSSIALRPLKGKGFPTDSHVFPAQRTQSVSADLSSPAQDAGSKDDSVWKAPSPDPKDYFANKQRDGSQDSCYHEDGKDPEPANVKISRNRRSSGINPIRGLTNVRAAAAQAAEAQKAIIAGQKDSKLHTASREDMPHLPKNQRAWLTDQCKKLVAENRGVRNVELEEYKDKNKAGPKQSASTTAPKTEEQPEVESERAELQSKLAQKFRKDLADMPSSSQD